MKLWTTEHTFCHPWKKVTEAAWKKYPNELNTNVTAIDVLNRQISEDGCLLTTRIFGSHWNLPKLITSLLGMPEMCYAVEHSDVDMKNEKMTLKTVNYTFWGILAVEETLVYQGDKEDPDRTHLTQGAKISVNGIQFANYFEDLIVSNFDATAIKGRTALEQVINKIKIEDIINTVTEEIDEIRCDLDKATSMLDSEFHVTDQLKVLAEDLDKATNIINSELQIVSAKLSTEFSQLINVLASELDQITIKVSMKPSSNEANINLIEAVKKAGIGVK